MAKSYNVAVVGATGIVGEVFLDILAKRPFPLRSLKLIASPRSAGKKITFGSSPTLLRELRILNERTWRADAATLGQWRFAGPDLNRSLELNARFAFAIFLELCGKSVAHRLPMKLDY